MSDRRDLPPGLAAVTGFLTPAFTEELPNGRHMHAMSSRTDFDRIETGYACANCLATFASFVELCPVCGVHRGELSGQQTPRDWDAYWLEHLNGGVTGRPNTSEDMLRRVAADSDIDQAKLSSLRQGSAWRKHRHG